MTGDDKWRLWRYGTDFVSSHGHRCVIVALTQRHSRSLCEVTSAVEPLQSALEVDFTDEGDRFEHRNLRTVLLARWFAAQSSDAVTAALAASDVIYDSYRSFTDVVALNDATANPLFERLEQPGFASYLASRSPAVFDGSHVHVHTAAVAIGADSPDVFGEVDNHGARFTMQYSTYSRLLSSWRRTRTEARFSEPAPQ